MELSDGDSIVQELFTQLGSKGEHKEPQRMGAAYSLARLGKQGSRSKHLWIARWMLEAQKAGASEECTYNINVMR